MIRVISLVVFCMLIIFGTLLYIKYGKHYIEDGFVDVPVAAMGNVPVIQQTSAVPNTMPGSNVSDPTKPTLSDLENTLSRIDFEKRSLENIRSTSENVKSRIAILDKVKADLSEYISKINRQKMSINDIPFSKRDLGAFLLKKDDTLSTKTIPDKTHDVVSGSNNMNEHIGDLKWKVSIKYDPNTRILKSISDKMEKIDKEIMSNTLTPTQIDTKMLELKILEQQAAAVNKRSITKSDSKLSAYTNRSTENSESVSFSDTKKPFFMDQEQPSFDQTQPSLDQGHQTQGFHDYTKRVSAASFDHESVVGHDYKKKATFLCSQIQNADLGDPVDFGCIKNPETDVSPDYSWRGNYKMVCSRLGRIWGGWYPEMFGCPATVGTDEQAPVIFESNK